MLYKGRNHDVGSTLYGMLCVRGGDVINWYGDFAVMRQKRNQYLKLNCWTRNCERGRIKWIIFNKSFHWNFVWSTWYHKKYMLLCVSTWTDRPEASMWLNEKYYIESMKNSSNARSCNIESNNNRTYEPEVIKNSTWVVTALNTLNWHSTCTSHALTAILFFWSLAIVRFVQWAWKRANSPWRLLDFHARDYRECLACFRSSSPQHIDVVTDLDERIFLAAAPVHLCTVLWHRRMAFYSRWCCDNSRCRLNFVRACHLDPAWQSTVPWGCFVDCGSRSMLWSRENEE